MTMIGGGFMTRTKVTFSVKDSLYKLDAIRLHICGSRGIHVLSQFVVQ